MIRVMWTWNGNDIEYKDFKDIDKAEEFRNYLTQETMDME